MSPAVRTRIVKIGNSQGVRIPRVLLEQADLTEEVELELREGEIVLRSVREVRSGWEQAFKAMADQRDDELLDADLALSPAWDQQEWEW